MWVIVAKSLAGAVVWGVQNWNPVQFRTLSHGKNGRVSNIESKEFRQIAFAVGTSPKPCNTTTAVELPRPLHEFCTLSTERLSGGSHPLRIKCLKLARAILVGGKVWKSTHFSQRMKRNLLW